MSEGNAPYFFLNFWLVVWGGGGGSLFMYVFFLNFAILAVTLIWDSQIRIEHKRCRCTLDRRVCLLYVTGKRLFSWRWRNNLLAILISALADLSYQYC